MPSVVTFLYRTGLSHAVFSAARLAGSWARERHPSAQWTSTPMIATIDDAGAPAFVATVSFPDDSVGTTFEWGVNVTGRDGGERWGIAREGQRGRTCAFVLRGGAQTEEHFLTSLRRLGAHKLRGPDAT